MSRARSRSWILGLLAVSAVAGLTGAAAVRGAEGGMLLLVTANTNGVLEPCGCSNGQGGGLARRATVITGIRSGGRRPLLIDGGNIVARLAPDAEILQQARRLLPAFGYTAAAVGPAELSLGAAALSRAAGGGLLPLITTNVSSPSGETLGRASVVVGQPPDALEVFAVVSPSLTPPGFTASEPVIALRQPLAAARAAGRRVVVISHQPAAEAQALRQALPGISLMLTSGAPVGSALREGDTWVVALPSNGRELARLDLTADVGGLVRRDVGIGKDVPADPTVSAPLRLFYEGRRTGLNRPRAGYGGKLPDSQGQAAAQCGSCHLPQQRHWAASKHALAWHTLEEKRADSRKDCVSCHTTSRLEENPPKPFGVGCAACHGDGAAHERSPTTPGLIRRRPNETLCKGCHTEDAAPQFQYSKYLPTVRH